MFTTRFTVRKLALTAATAAGTMAVLTACGSGGDDSMVGHDGMTSSASAPAPAATTASVQPTADFNDDDVMFAQMMIPHHEQAVEMAKLAETRAADPEIKELAAKIQAAQDPEIAAMTGWLTAWGKATMPEGEHGGHGMPGMMTEEDMVKLQQAKGAAFDRMFAELMIAHHKGAIEMAKTEQERGVNPAARQLAATIETAQQAEIEQMNKILERL
ncbi:DUF305 domain-containing protein [Planomonospora sp. ID91781]|uniref:DUF305 domain-containing protein n=1 Tax=Planomonospora sp. ID91781 TaxID=2738135 RepID=UPI0018C4416F|nr:DUF305 domain-containing protein [Planomonospora sp. ID91781]MBG0823295.1 DUF305 domain-containing protein [Planomonospora sp. ID91781]